MRRFTSLIALAAVGLALHPSSVGGQAPNRIAATVISVVDGDTLRASINSTSTAIRLACIDAPETDQPGGGQATARLRQLLPRNAQIQLNIVDTDRYGRKVAEVYRNGALVNLQMVQEGRAVVYPQYLNNCPNSRDRLQQAETQARRRRLAFWSQRNPIMPWNWQQGVRPAPVPSPTNPASNCDPSYPDVCIPPNAADLDCSQIPQRRFRVLPPDPHQFDRDRDGIGCES